jgi:hypothetical protein
VASGANGEGQGGNADADDEGYGAGQEQVVVDEAGVNRRAGALEAGVEVSKGRDGLVLRGNLGSGQLVDPELDPQAEGQSQGRQSHGGHDQPELVCLEHAHDAALFFRHAGLAGGKEGSGWVEWVGEGRGKARQKRETKEKGMLVWQEWELPFVLVTTSPEPQSFPHITIMNHFLTSLFPRIFGNFWRMKQQFEGKKYRPNPAKCTKIRLLKISFINPAGLFLGRL